MNANTTLHPGIKKLLSRTLQQQHPLHLITAQNPQAALVLVGHLVQAWEAGSGGASSDY
jgi:hypothetical protein